ncbi:MAG: acetylxylan esterase [Spirochaetes bacterium]|nr:acetylxylan esterase [Spirochaetota bacterium]
MAKPILAAALLLSGSLAFAAPIWNTAELFPTPKAARADGFTNEGLTAWFIEGLPYKGKPTKVFAWYGAPAYGTGKKYPAMVVIHGGGGTAFAEWVQLWNKRGYAAIAMDTTGCTPQGNTASAKRVRHDAAGPNGWGGFDQVDDVMADQWPYHAVAAVVRAHSLLRSFPEVDVERVGVTGISWGGYLTSVVSGVDSRFKCAIPVYGCGFYGEDSAWTGKLKDLGEKGALWLSRFDASQHLAKAAMPMLWVSGTGDHFFPMPSLQKSYRLPSGPRALALRVNMPHSHTAGWAPNEIAAFTESLFSGKPALTKLTGQGHDAKEAWATWASPVPMAEAELNYTTDSGVWEHRWWMSTGARLDEAGKRAVAEIPPEATVFFLNLVDKRGLLASSEHVERAPLAAAPAGRRILIDENNEGRVAGSVPIGVVGAAPEKGATIAVSEEAAAGGKASLKFADAPGLAKAWEPLREFKFSGARALTNGKVTLSFAFMNHATKPAQFTVELRDNSQKQYQTGPILEFQKDGKVVAGGLALPMLKNGSWTRVKLTFTPGAPSKDCGLELTPAGEKTQVFRLPHKNTGFSAVHWLGLILYNDAEAICYLDDLKLVSESE